jgi:hypothetical protein
MESIISYLSIPDVKDFNRTPNYLQKLINFHFEILFMYPAIMLSALHSESFDKFQSVHSVVFN